MVATVVHCVEELRLQRFFLPSLQYAALHFRMQQWKSIIGTALSVLFDLLSKDFDLLSKDFDVVIVVCVQNRTGRLLVLVLLVFKFATPSDFW
jgi:hypothetical protein